MYAATGSRKLTRHGMHWETAGRHWHFAVNLVFPAGFNSLYTLDLPQRPPNMATRLMLPVEPKQLPCSCPSCSRRSCTQGISGANSTPEVAFGCGLREGAGTSRVPRSTGELTLSHTIDAQAWRTGNPDFAISAISYSKNTQEICQYAPPELSVVQLVSLQSELDPEPGILIQLHAAMARRTCACSLTTLLAERETGGLDILLLFLRGRRSGSG